MESCLGKRNIGCIGESYYNLFNVDLTQLREHEIILDCSCTLTSVPILTCQGCFDINTVLLLPPTDN